MSLNITIVSPSPIKKIGTGIYARVNGATKELTRQEAIEHFPDVNPDSIIEYEYTDNVYWEGNITHNLTEMAEHCMCDHVLDLYKLLWRDSYPVGLSVNEYIKLLLRAKENLETYPDDFKKYNPENGWGTYEQLLNFVKQFMVALITMPEGCEIKYDR